MRFWNKIKSEIPDINIIAEDLGGETDEVKQRVKNSPTLLRSLLRIFQKVRLYKFYFSRLFMHSTHSTNSICK
jgi:hypothetical protein